VGGGSSGIVWVTGSGGVKHRRFRQLVVEPSDPDPHLRPRRSPRKRNRDRRGVLARNHPEDLHRPPPPLPSVGAISRDGDPGPSRIDECVDAEPERRGANEPTPPSRRRRHRERRGAGATRRWTPQTGLSPCVDCAREPEHAGKEKTANQPSTGEALHLESLGRDSRTARSRPASSTWKKTGCEVSSPIFVQRGATPSAASSSSPENMLSRTRSVRTFPPESVKRPARCVRGLSKGRQGVRLHRLVALAPA
jgi:hypothetical protein